MLKVAFAVAIIVCVGVAVTPAQDNAVDALRKAGSLDRLAERQARPAAGSPGFVVDPAWPKPLPNNWIIGDVGGLYVDRRRYR